MDDLIFLFLDLVADLLGVVLPLIGKFWFLILGYLAYKLFGRQGKKWVEEQPKRTLTPVETGGFPPLEQPQERKKARASSTYEPIAPDEVSAARAKQEWAAAKAVSPSSPNMRSGETQGTAAAPFSSSVDAKPDAKPLIDPREGMKWALIFGQPRSKSPYVPPYARRKE